MAGYRIYSLDWTKFSALVSSPSTIQLSILAKNLAENLKDLDGEIDEDDSLLDWPTNAKSLTPLIVERLALSDWYGDLTDVGRELWEGNFYGTCMNSKKLDVGYRVDSNGVYWNVMNLIVEKLGDRPEKPGKSAMSRFGTVPFRYHPLKKSSSDWHPMHSMHPPDEVRRMLQELRSVAPVVEAAEHADDRQQFSEELLPAVERVVADGRLLFIQVDT